MSKYLCSFDKYLLPSETGRIVFPEPVSASSTVTCVHIDNGRGRGGGGVG